MEAEDGTPTDGTKEEKDKKPVIKKEDQKDASVSPTEKPLVLSKAVKEENCRLLAESKRLHDLVTKLQQSHHEISIKNSDLVDSLGAAETEVAELKNKVDDLEYHLAAERQVVDKLDKHLSDALQKLKTYQEGEIKVQGGGEGVSKNKVSPLKSCDFSCGTYM